jgi:hypothetical protein
MFAASSSSAELPLHGVLVSDLAGAACGVLDDGCSPLHSMDAGNQGGYDQAGSTEQLLISPGA